jgi:hypothetical protein
MICNEATASSRLRTWHQLGIINGLAKKIWKQEERLKGNKRGVKGQKQELVVL